MRTMKIVKVNFSEIEDAIKDGNRVTVKNLAEAYSVSPPVLRRTLSEHYGSRIVFKRGRNGGLAINPS